MGDGSNAASTSAFSRPNTALRRESSRNCTANPWATHQQGFASADPYIYENEVPSSNKPITYQLIHDTGYPYDQAPSL
jgi:hypothetical protein